MQLKSLHGDITDCSNRVTVLLEYLDCTIATGTL